MPTVIEEMRKNGAYESGIGLPHSRSHSLSRQRLGVRQPYAALNSDCWGVKISSQQKSASSRQRLRILFA